ncbi:MAG: TRAP transporter large permease subunit [Clostridiales Family XIII bacterium]|jgi:tripartite ATP-independent transporter DctM subunit|nr:TRAP transporter large permease subunit [Clostridiales Family XIII bacterium]
MAETLVFLITMLLISLFLGVPVSTALGFTALAATMAFMGPVHLTRFGVIAFTQGTSLNQMVAPLFIVMAEFLARGGVAGDIYEMLSRLMRRVRGGLALSTTLACTVFAALCGSSPATAASIGRISISQMTSRGYRPDFAVGTVAAGGTLGIMIPPSLTFVLYGIITETSIAKLLMAGLLPGIMLSVMFCVSIIIRVRINPGLAVAARPEKFETDDGDGGKNTVKQGLFAAVPALALILLVLGTMYTGFATPTEAAGFGAVGALIIVFCQRRLDGTIFKETLLASARTSCMILFMIIMGFCLSYVISYLSVAQQLAVFVIDSGMNRWVIMAMLFVLWFVMGCLMDPGSMVILTIPFIYPALIGMGFDAIWLGVVSTLCVEIGMITPPVGLNLFILRSISETQMGTIIKGALPYVGVLVAGLIILCVFPQIALALPSLM